MPKTFVCARISELEQENARLKGYESSLLREPESPQYGSRLMRPERNMEAEIQRRLGIFRGLFRGREDVFAKRFVSKAGYRPVFTMVGSIDLAGSHHREKGNVMCVLAVAVAFALLPGSMVFR